MRAARLALLLLLVLFASDLLTPGAAPAAGAAARARWSWPSPPPHEVVAGFEAPAEAWSPGLRGIDIDMAASDVVVAPDTGVVHFAGVVVDRPVVSIEHEGGILSSMEPVDPSVSRGDVVEKGQPIGALLTGHCDGAACLHLGARLDGSYISPLLMLGEIRPAILLPTEAIR